MRSFVKILLVGVVGSFLFSGCAFTGKFGAYVKKENNVVKGMTKAGGWSESSGTNGYTDYQDPNNAVQRCSINFVLYMISKKAIENGYNYFLITYKAGSNKNPAPIVTVDKMVHYCDPGYFDKETNLLEDKCTHMGLGKGYPKGIGGFDVRFFKKRNPFVPLWDARKILKETKAELVNVCYKDDPGLFQREIEKSRFKEE